MSEPKFPVHEIFGPTLQGEGIHIGRVTTFIRFAGCDTRCDWCDTKEAWNVNVAKQMTVKDILYDIDTHMKTGQDLVVLTGGNPALYDLTELVKGLQRMGLAVHVETQGTLFPDWLHKVDFISFSPKIHENGGVTGPSKIPQMVEILDNAWGQLKFIIGDRTEYRFAKKVAELYPDTPMVFQSKHSKGIAVNEGMFWLANLVCKDPGIPPNVRYLPQLHKVIWGDDVRGA